MQSTNLRYLSYLFLKLFLDINKNCQKSLFYKAIGK